MFVLQPVDQGVLAKSNRASNRVLDLGTKSTEGRYQATLFKIFGASGKDSNHRSGD
jgi:hypothetical protein